MRIFVKLQDFFTEHAVIMGIFLRQQHAPLLIFSSFSCVFLIALDKSRIKNGRRDHFAFSAKVWVLGAQSSEKFGDGAMSKTEYEPTKYSGVFARTGNDNKKKCLA